MSIFAGGWNSFLISSNESVYCWGSNESGQIGDGKTENIFEPKEVEELKDLKIKKIKSLWRFTLFLSSKIIFKFK